MFRRILIILAATFFSTFSWAAEIAVVYPVLSVPKSEQRYAQSMAGHVQRWYETAGIEVDCIPDASFIKSSSHSLVVMVDCYAPTTAVVQAVKRRLDAGTRFVVCYSGSPALAALFGLKPVAYKQGAWHSMRLGASRPQGAPSTITQTSTNIFSMQSIRKDTTAMGYWQGGSDEREVAWWRTARGSYWMTHILSGKGDEEGKQLLLLAIAAESNPTIWAKATQKRLAAANEGFTDGSLHARISSLPASSARRQELDKMYRGLLAQRKYIQTILKTNPWKAYFATGDFRSLISRTYGATYFSKPGEVCGVWDHSGQGLYPGDWNRTAKELARLGVTDLYVNVAGAGFARYPSKILPRASNIAGDCLAEAVAAGHANGLRVHAWILSFSCEMASSSTITLFKKNGWTLQEQDGTETTWLDPTHPQVRARVLSIVKEIVSMAKVDGVHLDFIRYPGFKQTLGPRVRARFKADGGNVNNWPDCVTQVNGASREAFIRWRAGKIADTVSNVKSWLRVRAPQVTLSTAVYGKYPDCIASVGQDWLSWLRMGIVDQVLPMNYTESLPQLREWLATQTSDPRLARRIVCGIGVTAAESRLSPVQTLQQINEARRAKCAGFALFDLDETLRSLILPVLSEGVMKR